MMDVLAYLPLDLSKSDGLFDANAAEKFVEDSTKSREAGRYCDLRLYLTDNNVWVLNTVIIDTWTSTCKQVDDATARAWLETNGYAKAIKRYFP